MPDLPQTPLSPPLPTPSLPPLPPSSPPKNYFILLAVFILVAISLVGGYYLYSTYPTSSSPSTALKSPTPAPITKPLEGFAPMSDASQLLIYTKDNKNEVYGDEEVILLNPHTQVETLLPLKKVNSAYKYYGSDLLFYLLQNDRGEYHILNLKTGVEETYDLLDHTDKSVNVTININNITEISPDGKYLVFNGSFFSPCPTPSPFPSGFEGGFGPCGPEESLDNPVGYYLYDIQNKKSTYLRANTIRVSRWDTEHSKLYFVDYDSNMTKALDLENKSIMPVDSTNNFGYFVYPLVKQNQIVKFEGATGDSGTGPFGKIYLVKNSDRSETKIDSTNTWTDIQPFITSNPSESDVLYRRAPNVNGIHRNSIYRYNLQDGQTTRLTKDDKSLSYSIYVTWLNDHEMVTSVDMIEEDNFSNQNQYLVKIDLDTLQETRLTKHDGVMHFNSQ